MKKLQRNLIILSLIGLVSIIWLSFKINFFKSISFDVLCYYGAILAALITIQGLRLTFDDNRRGIEEQSRLDKLPILAVTALQQSSRIPWLDSEEKEVLVHSEGISQKTEDYYYDEFELDKIFFIIKKDGVTAKNKLSIGEQNLIIHGGLYQEKIGAVTAMVSREIIYVPIKAENVGTGAVLNLRIGLIEKKNILNEDDQKYTVSINMMVSEVIYIGIFVKEKVEGAYFLTFHYTDVFGNRYEQKNELILSSNKDGKMECKFSTEVVQVPIELKYKNSGK